MRGCINAIWLAQSNSTLPESIVTNLTAWLKEISPDFEIILWTNRNGMDSRELKQLIKTGITIKKTEEYKKSQLYKYFEYFLQQDIGGDEQALARAINIFKIIALEFTSINECYIYVNAKNIKFIRLSEHLDKISKYLHNSSLGFYFYIDQIKNTPKFEAHDDVLIAYKNANPQFFASFLHAYWIKAFKNHSLQENPHIKDADNYDYNPISADFFYT